MGKVEEERFRFGLFEADAATGELRRAGLRVRIHAQPFQVLLLLLQRPGELLTREEIARELWPEGTFVDFEHGVNSAVNRIREALGDRASNPRFVETLARRGYRFVAPVERLHAENAASPGPALPTPVPAIAEPVPSSPVLPGPSMDAPEPPAGRSLLASAADLPATSAATAQLLFLALQAMYLAFYVGALCNLSEIADLLQGLDLPAPAFPAVLVSAALLIPVRIFLFCAALFRAPHFAARFRRLWPVLLVADLLWATSPFLLLHHIPGGLALACTAVLVYAPFAQRSLVLMGAGTPPAAPLL